RHASAESFSPDGKLLAIDLVGAGSPGAIAAIATDGSGTPVMIPGPANMMNPKFSPDGRYLAYTSAETRNNEVYVQTWPAAAGKWQVSSGGGQGPRWRSDGKELFYRTPDMEFFAVPVTLGAQFSAGIPKALFKRRIVTGSIGIQNWSIAADGQKLLLNAAAGS